MCMLNRRALDVFIISLSNYLTFLMLFPMTCLNHVSIQKSHNYLVFSLLFSDVQKLISVQLFYLFIYFEK